MLRRRPPRKVTYFEPIPPRLARNTVIGRFRCTMRINCGELDPGAVIRPVAGEWYPHMPQRLDEGELADWRAGRNNVTSFRFRHGHNPWRVNSSASRGHPPFGD